MRPKARNQEMASKRLLPYFILYIILYIYIYIVSLQHIVVGCCINKTETYRYAVLSVLGTEIKWLFGLEEQCLRSKECLVKKVLLQHTLFLLGRNQADFIHLGFPGMHANQGYCTPKGHPSAAIQHIKDRLYKANIFQPEIIWNVNQGSHYEITHLDQELSRTCYVFVFADRAKALFFIRFSSPFVCSLCWTILCSQNDFSFCLSWIRAAFITWQQQLHSSRRNTSPQKLRCGFNKIWKSVYLLLALFTSFLFCFLSLPLCPLSLPSVSSSPLFPL